MKFIISLFICFAATKALALIQIEYMNGKKDNAITVKNILMNKYLVPENLIVITTTTQCNPRQNNELILDSCINEKGELEILSYNEVMLKKSFKIFKETF